MQEIKASEIAKMCGGVVSPVFAGEQAIYQVSIDSRKVLMHGLFVALKGENSDGHDFVAEVVAKPGNFAVVSHSFSSELANLIRVDDTTLALGALASSYRQLFPSLQLVAVTGSNGKTTLKEMLKLVCQEQFGVEAVLATSGNLNNHLGVPLTLLELTNAHRVAIIEMGMNHSGELSYLSKLARPTLACVNNVMFAHAGHFQSLDEIAAAKAEIFEGLDQTGTACLDLSNQYSQAWQKQLLASGVPIFSYANSASQCYLKRLSSSGGEYVTPLGGIHIKLAVLGEHNYSNALSVIALAINLGCSLDAIKTGLEAYLGYPKRLEPKRAFNGALMIDDSYNANPDSVKAALQAIQVLAKPYWFIFADLKELGADELKFHQEIGAALDGFAISQLLTVGELAAHAAEFYPGAKIHFSCNQDIVKYCLANLPKNVTVLVKGSNSMQLQEIVQQLTIIK